MKGLLLLLLSFELALGQDGFPDKSLPKQAAKVAYGLSWQVLNINNLWTWHRSDGEGNHSPGGDGTAYPVFTGRCIYEDNLIFGGIMYVNNFPESGGTKAAYQPIRVNGGTYLSHHGMVNGWVNGTGSTAIGSNPDDPLARIFRIRRDFMEMSTAELRRDAAIYFEQLSTGTVTQSMIDVVLAQYNKDWVEWPVQHGAPFIDRNGNGVYDPPPPFSNSFTVDNLIDGQYDEPGLAVHGGLPADQVMFTVYNGLDRGKAIFFVGSEPIGLEVQKTVWGYKSGTELAENYFVRYVLINKGGVDVGGGQKGSFFIDSLFVGQFADMDIGNAGDDLNGCDTLLQLGYSYNANETDISYERFELDPPSAGYTVLSGPLVPAPADSGLFAFRKVYGKKNLGMTAYAPIVTNAPYYSDPPFGTYETGTGRWWSMLRGYAPIGTIYDAPVFYPHPLGYSDTFFPFSGDPVTQTGLVDGLGTTYSFGFPGDRRCLLSTGPSRLAPNDTAEFIIAVAVGLGSDRLSSITIMKQNIVAARSAAKNSFEFARPPEKPGVTATGLNREIILNWGSKQARVEATEQKVFGKTYAFEGYNVYQLPVNSATITDGIKLATFDLKNGVTTISNAIFNPANGLTGRIIVQDGTDSGIKHFLSVSQDMLSPSYTGLSNGREYVFGVTAYNYSTDDQRQLRSLESEPAIVSVVPQIPFGAKFTGKSGDSLEVIRASGVSDGSIDAVIFDPLHTTGHTYEIRFDTLGTDQAIIHDNAINRDILSIPVPDLGKNVIANVDGIQIDIISEQLGIREFLVTANALGPLEPPEIGCFAFNSSGFPRLYNSLWPNGTDRPAGNRQQSGGLTLDQGWGIHAGGVEDNTYSTFKKVITNGDSTWARILRHDFEIRFTAAGSQARVQGTASMIPVPFELWNVGSDSASASDDYRMIPVVSDTLANGVFDYDGFDHVLSGSDNDPETDWFSWYDPIDRTPGQGGYSTWVSSGGSGGIGALVMKNMTLVLWNGGSVSDPSFPANVSAQMPEVGTIFKIITQKLFGPNDLFTFTAPAVLSGSSAFSSSAKRAGVFPNPYFAGWSYEGEPIRNYVTFNNLPPRATIRIFNLAGHLVRTLEKNDPSQFVRWDLTNEHNWQVGSGIYICYVEMPDIGQGKIVKLAIIQSEAPPTY